MQDVFRTAEAYERFGRAHTLRMIRRGLWQRLERGVIVTHNGPIDAETRERVVLAACAPGSAMAGLTALQRDGLTGFSPVRVQIVQPDGARRTVLDDLELHWSERLDDRDVHPVRKPRRTRVARSVVDAASWTAHRRLARAIVIAAVQQRLVTPAQLRDALTRRGKCRHRALIVQSVLDARGGIQSLPERDMRAILDELGWTATHQKRIRGVDGTYFLDLHIADLNLGIEVHGIPHLSVQNWDKDLFRANEIVIAGERLLIFSSYAIRHERAAVIAQLRRFAARVAA